MVRTMEGEKKVGRRSACGAGKIGRPKVDKVDGRQRRLVMEKSEIEIGGGDSSKRKMEIEEREGEKKVTFRIEGERGKGNSEEIEKFKKEIRELINQEKKALQKERKLCEEYLKPLKEKEKAWEEKLIDFDMRLEDMAYMIGEKLETGTEEGGEESKDKWQDEGDDRIERVRGRKRSESIGRRSGYSSAGESMWELGSVRSEGRLNNREVDVMKKWVAERDKEERKNNIVIKGVAQEAPKDIREGKRWLQNLMREKIKVECHIKSYRVSGPVVVAKIESEEKKKEIMMNKNRLKGERMFIENDLNWDERKIQEKISR